MIDFGEKYEKCDCLLSNDFSNIGRYKGNYRRNDPTPTKFVHMPKMCRIHQNIPTKSKNTIVGLGLLLNRLYLLQLFLVIM